MKERRSVFLKKYSKGKAGVRETRCPHNSINTPCAWIFKDHCFHQDLCLIHDSSIRQAPYGLKVGKWSPASLVLSTTTHHPMYLHLPVAMLYKDESLAWSGMSQHANSYSQYLQVLGVAQLPNQRSKGEQLVEDYKSVLIPSLMNS